MQGGSVPKRILIVDDHAFPQHMVQGAFEASPGWERMEAANAREAVEKAQVLKPDLVVLDLWMPIVNGLGAARVLRRLLPTVPIILLTPCDYEFPEEEAFSAGVTALISKGADLVNQVQDLLRVA
jgi:CheY-like chemotaxis protein